jgi:hypothetical protein
MYRRIRSCRKRVCTMGVKSKEQLVHDTLTNSVVNDAVITYMKEASDLRQGQNYLLPYQMNPSTLVLCLIRVF